MLRLVPRLLALLLLATPAAAHEFTAGPLTIEHPWSRATPPTAKVGAGFLEIVNAGDKPDRLIAVETEAAGRTELHLSVTVDGVMQMRPLPDGIEIPPQSTVTLAPGGLHIMFMELKAPLVEQQEIPAVLVFEQAGRVAVEFAVEALGAEPSHDSHGKSHGSGS